MICVYFEYHSPTCDGCGHMLAAEADDAAAEDAMRADGWTKAEGKDLCRLCQIRTPQALRASSPCRGAKEGKGREKPGEENL